MTMITLNKFDVFGLFVGLKHLKTVSLVVQLFNTSNSTNLLCLNIVIDKMTETL